MWELLVRIHEARPQGDVTQQNPPNIYSHSKWTMASEIHSSFHEKLTLLVGFYHV